MIVVKIKPDTSPESPREWSNLGTMACWHQRYELGDEQPKCAPEEYLRDLPEGSIALPLYLSVHGQVGIIYVTPARIAEEYGDTSESSCEKARAVLISEVKVYDQYLTGDVWGFVIEEVKKCECCYSVSSEHVDSCWGFYGDDLEGMKHHVDAQHHAALEAAWRSR